MKGLKGNAVFLRALEPEDADLLYEWENDTSIWHLGSTHAPYSRHLLNQFIESHPDIYANKQLRLMICLHNGKAIGAIDLFDFSPQHLRAGVGILIADQSERRKGLGSESLSLLINYAFQVLELKQLFCNILEDNESSIQLFKNHRFEICGNKKSWVKVDKSWKNELMFQLISPEAS